MTKEEFLREVMGEVTEETLLAMVKKESGNIKFIPPNLQTEAICLEAVKEWAHNIQYVANVTPAIRDAAIAAPRPGNGPMRGFDILSHIPDELKTEEICYKAVKKNECNLEGVPEHLQTERICLVAIRKSCYALRHVKKPTPAIYNAMADSYSSSWVAENVPEEYLTEEFFLRAMDNRFVIYVTDIPVKYLTPKVLAKLAVREKTNFLHLTQETGLEITEELLHLHLEKFPFKLHDLSPVCACNQDNPRPLTSEAIMIAAKAGYQQKGKIPWSIPVEFFEEGESPIYAE